MQSYKTIVSDYIKTGKTVEAYEYLIKIAPENSTNQEFWNYFGCFLHDVMALFAAIGAFKKAISLGPKSPNSWFNLGVSLMKFQEFEEAVLCLHECLRLAPEFTPAKELLKQYFASSSHQRCFFVSYPKCGRNWLRYAISNAISLHLDNKTPDDAKASLNSLCARANIPAPIFTHDLGEWGTYRETRLFIPEIERRNMIPDYHTMEFKQRTYEQSKVIFVIRNPLDVLVSSYFQITKLCNSYGDSLSNLIQDPHFGIKKIIQFFKIWERNKEKTGSFLLVRYEDLHENFTGVLEKTISFMGIKSIDGQKIQQVYEISKFNNMKKKLDDRSSSDPEATKIRKGKVGGYKDYFSQSDHQYLFNIISEEGCPFYDFELINGEIQVKW